jgi:hypothetical protein
MDIRKEALGERSDGGFNLRMGGIIAHRAMQRQRSLSL